MTPNPMAITPDTPVPVALRVMRERKVRRLFVLDSSGKLVGIASDKDLLYASPAPVTTLAVWEIPELLAKIKVEKVIAREVITMPEDTASEVSAGSMANRRIGSLPIMPDQTVVGIITETDLFKALLQLLGRRRSGVRMTASISEAKCTRAKITTAIFGTGGAIVGLGFNEVTGIHGVQWDATFKVQDVLRDTLVEALRPVMREILDVGEV